MRLSWVVAVLLVAGCGSTGPRSLFETLRSALGSQAIVGEVEPNGSTISATVLSGNDGVARANVKPIADTDYFRFTAQAGDRVYAATMTWASTTTNLDTVLDVVASDGTTILESDDDDGTFAGAASSIAGTVLPAAGSYYLRVSSPGQLRPYDLHYHLQRGAPSAEVEPNDNGGQAQVLPASGWVSGSLSGGADVDYYAITLAAGDTLFASLDLDPERDGVDTGAMLSLIGGLVANDPGNAGPDSEAAFATVRSPGTYSVLVIPQGAAAGSYVLSVAVHPATAAASTCTTYTNGTATAIPDVGTASSVITVPGAPVVADLDVSLSYTHSAPGDLDVSLTAPGGNEVVLFTDVGSTLATTVSLTLDEQAALPLPLMPWLPSTWAQPESAYRLHWFDGQSAGGAWTLKVRDDASANTGTLTSWALTLCERPPFSCPAGRTLQGLATYDFESGAAGWTHSGSLDTWALGTPTAAPINTCNAGTGCWKTNLSGTYSGLSSQDLVSPPVALPLTGAPLRVTWAMKYQLESDNFDHARVVIRESGGANARVLWEWHDATMSETVGTGITVQEAAGWATFSADVSDYAGKTVELVFLLDADGTNQFAGLAVDDVSFTQCLPPPCGNGALDTGEQCDLGASNGQPGTCCSASCQLLPSTTPCRAASGACDVAEQCTGASASCPPDGKAPNGAPCSDGDACTLSDTCQAGACTAGSPVVCPQPGVCHDPGTCNPATGVCSNPVKPAGAPCSDGDACSVGDTCQAGACTPGAPVSCAALDQCHVAGVCSPATGMCSNPPKMDGAACDDADECTLGDVCTAGACGGAPKQCPALDGCHDVGTCNPSNGVCLNPVKADGSACDDLDACTTADTCQGGTCAPGTAVVCAAQDSCHVAGLCDPATGACSNPAKADGVGCNDGDACTRSDSCQSGQCVGSNPVSCPLTECHQPGLCSPDSGTCVAALASDGSSCDGGVCRAGSCEPPMGTGGGSGGSGGGSGGSGGGSAGGSAGGAAGAGGGGGGGGGQSVATGCACGSGGGGLLALAALLLLARRPRLSSASRSQQTHLR